MSDSKTTDKTKQDQTASQIQGFNNKTYEISDSVAQRIIDIMMKSKNDHYKVGDILNTVKELQNSEKS